jgi:hypothetical protein
MLKLLFRHGCDGHATRIFHACLLALKMLLLRCLLLMCWGLCYECCGTCFWSERKAFRCPNADCQSKKVQRLLLWMPLSDELTFPSLSFTSTRRMPPACKLVDWWLALIFCSGGTTYRLQPKLQPITNLD